MTARAGQQPWLEHRPGPRQAGKEFPVWMRRIGRGNLLVKLRHATWHQLQLPADQLHPQHEAPDHRGFIRDGHRLGHQRQAFGPMPGFGNGWWRFRAPGWGVIDWRKVITALTDVGYEGNLDIEHEDEVFAKAAMSKIDGEADIVEMLGKEPNALVLGYRYLAPMMPLDSTHLLPH